MITSHRDLVRDFDKYAYYGFFMSLWVVPPQIVFTETELDQIHQAILEVEVPPDEFEVVLPNDKTMSMAVASISVMYPF